MSELKFFLRNVATKKSGFSPYKSSHIIWNFSSNKFALIIVLIEIYQLLLNCYNNTYDHELYYPTLKILNYDGNSSSHLGIIYSYAQKRTNPKNSNNPNSKLNELRQLSNNENYFALLNSNQYFNYALQEPKNYYVVVLGTVSSTKDCNFCKNSQDHFKKVAHDYSYALKHENQTVTNPVVFVKVELDNNNEIPFIHSIQSAPVIYVLKPGDFIRPQNYKKTFKMQIDENDIMLFSSGSHYAFSEINLLRWINFQTKNDVKFIQERHNLSNFFFYIALLCSSGIIIYIGRLLLLKYPILLPIGAIIVNLIGNSGLIFCIQNNSKFTQYGNDLISIFVPSSRSQTILEGLIISFVTILCGFSLFSITLTPRIKEIDNKVKILKYILYCSQVASCVFMWAVLQKIVLYKAPWLEPTFFPSDSCTRGWIRNDRGQTI